jgi:2-keto-4-pentenoate hydratase/2-oxohepta-3-ene-1,7-dioic acid hydratase in catechol pathway
MTRLALIEVDGQRRVAVGADDGSAVMLDPARYPTIASAVANVRSALAAASEGQPVAQELSFLPSLDSDARVFCVAQNYPAHAQEVSGADAPPAPIMFLKPTSAFVGHDSDIELSPVTSFLDYEAELAVMVGRHAAAVPAERAGGVIVAATCLNDGSARDLQPAELGGKPLIDWFSAKSLDRSSAIGPWLRLVNGAEDVSDLAISCRVNGEQVQDDRTSSMVHDVPHLVAFVSSRVALRPGDVIATGTPGGVGRARGVALADGDLVEVEVEGVGRLSNRVCAVGDA